MTSGFRLVSSLHLHKSSFLRWLVGQISEFLRHLRTIYRWENSYHNFQHALDVLQATQTFLFAAGKVPPVSILLASDELSWRPDRTTDSDTLISCLDNLDLFTLYIAAIGHDVGHPGFTNVFMVSRCGLFSIPLWVSDHLPLSEKCQSSTFSCLRWQVGSGANALRLVTSDYATQWPRRYSGPSVFWSSSPKVIVCSSPCYRYERTLRVYEELRITSGGWFF